MSKRWSLILLVVLAVLVIVFAVGKLLIVWDWWDFLLILAGLAFVVGLVVYLAQVLLRRASGS